MATKTISLEIDAYEKLKAAKRSPRESFSEVVRRARWSDTPLTAERLLSLVSAGRWPEGELDTDAIEAANASDAPPDDPWS